MALTSTVKSLLMKAPGVPLNLQPGVCFEPNHQPLLA